MIRQISNGHLVLDIVEPAACPGSRFDRTGWIRQVRLADGGHTFCMEEIPGGQGQAAGGSGLCGEFGISEAPGYGDTRLGECFPKLGVGLLRRVSEAGYDFHYPYPIAEPYATDAVYGANHAMFMVHALDCSGYSALLSKTITLRSNVVEIRYWLSNTGTKRIRTTEYVHNFMGINGCAIGPDYRLRVSFPIAVKLMEPAYTPQYLQLSGHDIRFNTMAEQPFYCQLEGYGGKPYAFWELIHQPSGAGVREKVSFPLAGFALWGTRHTVSPEMFIAIDVAPGQKQVWSRRYEFFQLED